MLFARAAGNKVHIDELLLLFLGCGPIVGEGNSEQFEGYRSNLGIRFAETICAIKDCQTTTTTGPRVERIGSLLTTLFRHFRLDLSNASYDPEFSRMDMQHLVHSKIIVRPNTYRFMSATGEDNFIELPNHALTQLSSTRDLGFQPPTRFLVPNPGRPSNAARPTTSRRSTSTRQQLDAEDIAPSAPPLALQWNAPSAASEFDLPPISDDPNDAEYRKWMIQSTKKNNSLMQRIMQTLSKGCCHANAARDAQPVPSTSASGSGQALRRKKRRTSRDNDDGASSR